MVNDSADFNTLKKMLNVTDGNLATHIASLEKNKFIKIKKKIIEKKTNTTYSITDSGKRAFNAHLNALEQLIKK